MPSISKDVKQQELSHTARRNINWFHHLRKLFGISHSSIHPAIRLLGIYQPEMQILLQATKDMYMYKNVPNSIIYNSLKLGITQRSIDARLDKCNTVYFYKTIPYSNENE